MSHNCLPSIPLSTQGKMRTLRSPCFQGAHGLLGEQLSSDNVGEGNSVTHNALPVFSNETHFPRNVFLDSMVCCSGLQSLYLAWSPLPNRKVR